MSPFLPYSVFALSILISAPAAATDEASKPNLDRYGGYTALKGERTGWFHLQQISGRYWLITPEGNAFLSKGVTGVRNQSQINPNLSDKYRDISRVKYGTDDKWADATVKRLRSWGLNTAGAWSSARLEYRIPYVVNLALAANAYPENQIYVQGRHMSRYTVPQRVPAPFHPAFRERVAARLHQFRTHFENPMCIGYFTDNEFLNVRDDRSYVKFYLEWDPRRLETFKYDKREVVKYLRAKYRTIDNMKEVYAVSATNFDYLAEHPVECDIKNPERALTDHYEIAALIGEQYARTVHEEIRRISPHQLIFGIRHTKKPAMIHKRLAPYVDVISLNHKPHTAPLDELRELHDLTGKPILFSEYSMVSVALDATKHMAHSDPGTVAIIEDQKSRYLAPFLQDIYSLPFVIGAHYYKYVDYPNSREVKGRLMERHVGLIDQTDIPKAPFLNVFTGFHERLEPRVVHDLSRQTLVSLDPEARVDGAVIEDTEAFGRREFWLGTVAQSPGVLLLYNIEGITSSVRAYLVIDPDIQDLQASEHQAYLGRARVGICAGWSAGRTRDELIEAEQLGRIPCRDIILKPGDALYGSFKPVYELSQAIQASIAMRGSYLAVKLRPIRGIDAPTDDLRVALEPLRVWLGPVNETTVRPEPGSTSGLPSFAPEVMETQQ